MHSKHLFLALTLTLGIGLLIAVPTPAAEPAAAEKIDQLIDQLSSRRYTARKDAQTELTRIGLPALEALRKAAQSKDMETRQRAAQLVAGLEKQIATKKILQPTYVELSYKEMPLHAALLDFGKKTGCQLHLQDQKVKDKKITLVTGKVTYWEAFDQLCEKAELVEVNPQRGVNQPGYYPPGIDLPVPVQPNVVPRRANPANNELKQIREKLEKLKEVEKERAIRLRELRGAKPDPKELNIQQVAFDELMKKAAQLAAEAKKAADIEAQRLAQQAAQQRALQQLIQIQVQQQAQIQVWNGPIELTSYRRYPKAIPSNQVHLAPGKLKSKIPTTYVGSLRLRLLANSTMLGSPDKDELQMVLEITPEPKLQWQTVDVLSLHKALDAQGQRLLQVSTSTGGIAPSPYTGIQFQIAQPLILNGRNGSYYNPYQQVSQRHFYVPVKVKKGTKPTKVLKELAGTLSGSIQTPTEALITVKDLMKKGKQTVDGQHGGTIQINSVQKVANNRVEIDVMLSRPYSLIPENNNLWMTNEIQLNNNGVVQLKQIGQVGGRRASGYGHTMNGLTLLDQNGKPIRIYTNRGRGGATHNGVQQIGYTITYQLDKGQEVDRLVFLGRRNATIDVRFVFKDVDLSK